MKAQRGGPDGGMYSLEYLIHVPVGDQLQIQVVGPPVQVQAGLEDLMKVEVVVDDQLQVQVVRSG